MELDMENDDGGTLVREPGKSGLEASSVWPQPLLRWAWNTETPATRESI